MGDAKMFPLQGEAQWLRHPRFIVDDQDVFCHVYYSSGVRENQGRARSS